MGFWSRWFARGRLKREPKGHTNGRLAPASVLRANLGIRDLGLEDAVVTMRGGERRAVFEIGGFPLHHADSEGARQFLGRFAQAINGLPAEAAFLVRSRPGGLGGDIHAAADAARGGGGLAALADDQAAYYRRLEAQGAVRETACYLAVRGDTLERLVEDAKKATSSFVKAGLLVTPLRGERMLRTIAESWRPGGVEQFTWTPYGPHLVFRQIGHRAILADRRPKATVQAVGTGKALPR